MIKDQNAMKKTVTDIKKSQQNDHHVMQDMTHKIDKLANMLQMAKEANSGMKNVESRMDRKFEKVDDLLYNLNMRMDMTEPRAIEASENAHRLA